PLLAAGEQTTAGPKTGETIEDRLKTLESKIDSLFGRFVAGPTTSTADPLDVGKSANSTTPLAADSRTPKRPLQSRPNPDATRSSIRKLEADLRIGLVEFERIEGLHMRGTVSKGELDSARANLLRTKAVLLDLDDELGDELDRLELELRKKQAELEE